MSAVVWSLAHYGPIFIRRGNLLGVRETFPVRFTATPKVRSDDCLQQMYIRHPLFEKKDKRNMRIALGLSTDILLLFFQKTALNRFSQASLERPF